LECGYDVDELFHQPTTDRTHHSLFISPVKAANAYLQAARLLETIHKKHWPELPPIKPLDTLDGVLDQIDHITASLVRPVPPLPADPMQELAKQIDHITASLVRPVPPQPMASTPPLPADPMQELAKIADCVKVGRIIKLEMLDGKTAYATIGNVVEPAAKS
jgi:hypothetical protein